MQLFTIGRTIDFMGMRKVALVFSLSLMLVAIGSLATKGLNLGIDFTGGTLIEVGYPEAADLGAVRSTLAAEGFNDATAQHFGTSKDVLIRLAPQSEVSSAALSTRAFEALNKAIDGKADLRRVEFVGPQVGEDLTEDGGLAVLYSLIGILIYVGFRFEYRFALSSIIALVHDVLITLGIFSLFRVEFDLTILAAILAVIGYSLNDTIVVFDRIRENFRKIRTGTTIDIINSAITDTLSRTTITSGTTLLVLIALFVFGGEIIHGFALALIIGIVVGTYSSIFVASIAIVMLGVSKESMLPVVVEDGETSLDDRP